MGDDPLAAYRRERSQRNNLGMEQGSQVDHSDPVQEPSFASSFAKATADKEATAGKPLTEHQALHLAIGALNQVPNHRLNGEYRNTYSLIPELQQAYENGKATEKLRDAAPELLGELINRVRAEEREAAEAGETETPWLNDARAVIAKAVSAPAPEQEVTRERDIEPER